MAVNIGHRRFSVRDYARLREAGILTEDERVELIDGEIRQMAPLGPLHSGTVKFLNPLIASQLGPDFAISVQDPTQLSDYSVPQPDLAILRARPDRYKRSHPTPADVLLVIEVADESEEYDREEKIPLVRGVGDPGGLACGRPPRNRRTIHGAPQRSIPERANSRARRPVGLSKRPPRATRGQGGLRVRPRRRSASRFPAFPWNAFQGSPRASGNHGCHEQRGVACHRLHQHDLAMWFPRLPKTEPLLRQDEEI